MEGTNNIHLNNENLEKNSNFKKEINIFNIYIYILVAIIMNSIIMFFSLPNEYLITLLYYNVVILGSVMFAGLAQNSRTSFFFNSFYAISFIVLFFTLGFRNYSAIDDPAYITIFSDVAEYGWIFKFIQSNIEPGFLILNRLVSIFTDNYLYMQLLSSFIPLILFYYGFKKYRNIISLPMAVFLLSTVLYFQILSAGLVRMFIALSIVFIAFYYIPRKKPIKFTVLILLASLFHYSALFMLILTYFSMNTNNPSKRAKRFLIVSFLSTPIVFISVSIFIVPLLGSRYAAYGTIGDLSISVSSFNTIPLLLFLLIFHKKFKGEVKDYFVLFITIYALSFIISFYSSMVPLGRLIFYSYLAFILGAAMIAKAMSKEEKKLLYTSVIVIYGFFYVYWTQFTLESHIPNLFPYQNIFFNI